MREIRIEEEILNHAIVDAINMVVRDVLGPRCPALNEIWNGPGAIEFDQLKYEVAATVATKWAVSQVGDVQ